MSYTTSMQSTASTVQEYLRELPEERRELVQHVRQVILDNLPAGYEEGMEYGMIGYFVPLSTFPDTYNGQPLSYVALASQKNAISLYLSAVYADSQREKELRAAFDKIGKKPNMGKSCVRFTKTEDIPLA